MAAPELLPPLALGAAIACAAGAAALANCALLAALLCRPNGLHAVIIQLAVADLLLLVTTIGPEMWSYNNRAWIFGTSCCVVHQGLNVFASTASLYLVTTIALHAIATVNLEEKAIARKNKRNNQEEDEEIRSSRHSLVATSDSSTPPRTMSVDYRRLTDTKLLVTRPTIFVWVLSASLSVPEFTLAATVNLGDDFYVCTLVDFDHRLYMHTLISLFNLFLPVFIMTIALAMILFKLKSKRRLTDVSHEAASALRLSVVLITVCVVMCIPRSVVNAYTVYSASVTDYDSESLVETVRHSQPSDMIAAVSLALSGVYLTATLVRPILCITMLPSIRKKMTTNCGRHVIENI